MAATTPNRYISSVASQKLGIDTPRMVPAVRVTSSAELRFSAPTMPAGTPMMIYHRKAPRNSSSVTGARRRNMLSTFSPVPTEVPQSPLTKFASQLANCT